MKQKRNPHRIVIKFGGKSLADGELILNAARTVASEVKKGKQVIVVVSAMGKTTDALLEIMEKFSDRNLPPSEIDEILSMGERTTCRIFSSALRSQGIESQYLDPAQEEWPIITDDRFTNASVVMSETGSRVKNHLIPLLERGIVPIVPGFVGKSAKSGKITTLGRGGSDITALALADLSGAKEAIFVTDVEGILSADPRLVSNPVRIKDLTVERLTGLADVGTKFIHIKALKYKKDDLDVRIVSYKAKELEASGTTLKGSFPELKVELLVREPVMSVTVTGNKLTESPAIISEVITFLKDSKIPLYGISSNSNSIILYPRSTDSKAVFEGIHEIVKRNKNALAMSVRKNLALLRIKGVGLEEKPGIISSVSKPLMDAGINIFGIFTITSSIFVLVEWADKEKARILISESLKG